MRLSSADSPLRSAYRAACCTDYARELAQDSVASGLDDSAAMLGDFRIKQLTSERLDASKRARFVATHQTRIANNVSDDNCSQFALDLWLAPPHLAFEVVPR
jgi:hypothetical protein